MSLRYAPPWHKVVRFNLQRREEGDWVVIAEESIGTSPEGDHIFKRFDAAMVNTRKAAIGFVVEKSREPR